LEGIKREVKIKSGLLEMPLRRFYAFVKAERYQLSILYNKAATTAKNKAAV
jgi:hypothetical protein